MKTIAECVHEIFHPFFPKFLACASLKNYGKIHEKFPWIPMILNTGLIYMSRLVFADPSRGFAKFCTNLDLNLGFANSVPRFHTRDGGMEPLLGSANTVQS